MGSGKFIERVFMFVEVYQWVGKNMVFFWLLVAMLFLFLEMGSPGLFFFVSFFFGALICAGSTFITSSLIAQSIIFLLGSIVSFLILHFWVRRKLKSKESERTNIYALTGKQAKVLKKISPPDSGKVKVYGEIWSARSLSDEVIEQDEYVEIVDVRGSHLYVKKVVKIEK